MAAEDRQRTRADCPSRRVGQELFEEPGRFFRRRPWRPPWVASPSAARAFGGSRLRRLRGPSAVRAFGGSAPAAFGGSTFGGSAAGTAAFGGSAAFGGGVTGAGVSDRGRRRDRSRRRRRRALALSASDCVCNCAIVGLFISTARCRSLSVFSRSAMRLCASRNCASRAAFVSAHTRCPRLPCPLPGRSLDTRN